MSLFIKMKNSNTNKLFLYSNYLVLAATSLLALGFTLLVANINLSYEVKSTGFSAVVCLYLTVFVGYYLLQYKQTGLLWLEEQGNTSELLFNSEVEGKLLALEEASEFFGASLKLQDMFRLISSRIGDLIPFTTCALFIIDQKRTSLKIVCAVGENARILQNFETDADKGLAGKTFISQEIQFEKQLFADNLVIPAGGLKGLVSGLAAPLFKNGEIFGVIALYANSEINYNENSSRLIEAVASRVTPLFLCSMEFERSVTNALTDALTGLPNERAFYLVLENQIAESQRNREKRPLTVLTIDIKNFTELNKRYGHATGDHILTFTAKLIKAQLRQMDFLSRSQSDEFLAVLPTATKDMELEIIERIEKQFCLNPFDISENEQISLQLNFGTASFGLDGETPNQLLEYAFLRKRLIKSVKNKNVLLFSKEYVNQP